MSLLDDILNPNVVDGVVTSMSERENITCLQKIMRIDKLIREYNKKYDELNNNYEIISSDISEKLTELANISDEIDNIISETEALLSQANENNNNAIRLINAFSSKYPTSYHIYNIGTDSSLVFNLSSVDYSEIYVQDTADGRIDIFINSNYIEFEGLGDDLVSIKSTKLPANGTEYPKIFIEIESSGINSMRKVYTFLDGRNITISIGTSPNANATIWSSIERRV